jgi:multidrug resistance protein, MATE family
MSKQLAWLLVLPATMSRPTNPTLVTLRHEFGPMFRLAVPVVFSELGWMTMAIVDTLMVGRLGAAAIGVVGLGGAIFYAVALFGLGILLGLDTLVAQAFGAGDVDRCHRALRQGLYLAVLATPVIMAVCWLVPPFFPSWRINPAVATKVAPFLRALSCGTLPLLAYAAFRRYLQATGHLRPVTFAMISANLINVFGNWMLVYGHLGIRALGPTGSGWSTAISRTYLAVMLGFFVWYFDREKGAGLFHQAPRFEWPLFKELVKLGAPSASQISLEVGAFSLATVLAGRLTPAALAAHQIVLNCASFAYMVPLGVSSAAAVRVGHAVGRREWGVARRAGWIAVGLAVAFMTCTAILFVTAPRWILGLFSPDPQTVAIGVALLAVAAVFQVFDAAQAVITGALRGLGNTRTPMLANLFGYWVFGLPAGYWLCFHRGWGLLGLWWGLSAGLIVIAVFLLLVWARESCAVAANAGAPAAAAAHMINIQSP